MTTLPQEINAHERAVREATSSSGILPIPREYSFAGSRTKMLDGLPPSSSGRSKDE
jgi:hypothetical protein